MLGFFTKNNNEIDGEWRTVAELKVGQSIAVPKNAVLERHNSPQPSLTLREGEYRQEEAENDILWDEIESIEFVGTEQVWDIEVEGTHNFVGNNIFAHNTYMNGSLGVGTSSPYAKLSVAGSDTTTTLIGADAPSGFTGNLMELKLASTTVLSVSGTGFSTTTVRGLNISGQATTTSNVGINLSAGCYAVNGTCVGGEGSGSGTVNTGVGGYLAYYPSNGTTVDDQTGLFWNSSNSNFGIGTTTPYGMLTINGGATAKDLLNFASTTGANLLNITWFGGIMQNISSTSALYIQNGSGAPVFSVDTTQSATNAGIDITAAAAQSGNLLNFYSTGGTIMSAFDATGRLGVGSSTPWTTLGVNGTASFSGLRNDSTGYYLCLKTTGEMATSTSACGASSIRFKENVEDLVYGLNEVLQYRPVFFNWKEDYLPSERRKQVGLIAEEVASTTPELVGRDGSGQVVNVDYPKLSAVLIKAIQELDLKVVALGGGTTTPLFSTKNSSTTATSTASSVWNNLLAFFKDLGLKIEQGLITLKDLVAEKIYAREIRTDRLCVDDVCVDKDQLKALLIQAGGSTSSGGGSSSGGSSELQINNTPPTETSLPTDNASSTDNVQPPADVTQSPIENTQPPTETLPPVENTQPPIDQPVVAPTE